MKRYDLELIQQPTLDGSDFYYDMEEAEYGEWVKYEDAEKLKELNLEMVEVINGLLTGDCERYEFVVKGRAIVAKAEGGD